MASDQVKKAWFADKETGSLDLERPEKIPLSSESLFILYLIMAI